MTQEEKLAVAQRYGDSRGYPMVTPAGDRDGYSYFEMTNETLLGRKTGIPRILKVGESGRVTLTRNIPEVMWAVRQLKERKEA